MRQVLTMKLRLSSNSGTSCLSLPNVVIIGVYYHTQLFSLVCQYIPHVLTNGNLLCPLKKELLSFYVYKYFLRCMYVHLIFLVLAEARRKHQIPWS